MGNPRLLWTDLETTGTDENRDTILEIATIITTPDLVEIDRYTTVIQQKAGWTDRMSPVVYEMHRANGLIREIARGDGVSCVRAETGVIERMACYGGKHDFMIAGSGVAHFDRRFLKAHMPELDSWLQYPALDVGSTRRQLEKWGGQDLVPKLNDAKTHRALDDVLLHLEEARHYQRVFQAVSHVIKAHRDRTVHADVRSHGAVLHSVAGLAMLVED